MPDVESVSLTAIDGDKQSCTLAVGCIGAGVVSVVIVRMTTGSADGITGCCGQQAGVRAEVITDIAGGIITEAEDVGVAGTDGLSDTTGSVSLAVNYNQ